MVSRRQRSVLLRFPAQTIGEVVEELLIGEVCLLRHLLSRILGVFLFRFVFVVFI